jgi:hypothetical protein
MLLSEINKTIYPVRFSSLVGAGGFFLLGKNVEV